ncbi:hypothetical protein HUA78_14445 [Myxococcus sp. CA033]|uniref:hypothetical protein n=1 Tax=Myxococcus sp. CA033 TaxID=2741516 RepID=UPI00157ACBAD|nr:hypothetical protein [Myxococcus sp. CA033]NTX35644.1 hypothetical protein [Myxococcus sp. CA033]
MNKLLGPVSFVLASAALAVALWAPGRTEAPSASERPEPVAALPASQEGLERRIQALEDTTLSLSRRLMELERRPAVAGTDGGGAAAPALTAELDQLRAEVRGLMTGETLSTEGGREALKDAMRSVQEEMRTEQFRSRQEEWMQAQVRSTAQRTERIKRLVSEAKLNYSQEQELTRRLEAEETTRNTLFEEVRTGAKNPREIRQAMRTQREETDQAMTALLDEGQRAKYDVMRREEQMNSRPRGNREGRSQDP